MSNFGNNPEFPDEEPLNVAATGSTTSDQVIYIIDTGGAAATFQAGMKNEDGSASVWASKTFNGRLYGRWTNVGANVQLAAYKKKPTTR